MPGLGTNLAGGRSEHVVLQDTPLLSPDGTAAAQSARQAEPAASGGSMRAKTFLAVPFQQHDDAKALEQMKRHTDFNDLATRSRLGKDAIGRQARAFVSKVIHQHAVRAEPHQRHGRSDEMVLVQQPRQRGMAKLN